MAAKRKFKSDAFEAIHTSIAGMYRSGTVDKATMRRFDATCLCAPSALGQRRNGRADAQRRAGRRQHH
jgi:putative transcriptional regulator